jgi:Putative MetA-pathway of phenol degradation
MLLCATDRGWGQFTDPRTYTNSPVGVNQLELGYGYEHANSSIDVEPVVTGASLYLNQGTITYTRYFGLLGHMAWVEPSVPIASLSGSVDRINISGMVTGMGDSSYMAGVLLKGGPALNAADFTKFKPVTTVGASITITAPTGHYDANKVLNLGADRWSFKPEIAYSVPFGRDQSWEFDAYCNTYFYTDNTSYRGIGILRQQALIGFEGHVIHDFNNMVWASLDTRYSFRGDTFVNGVNQDSLQKNFLLGSEVNVSVNAKNSFTVVFGTALVHQNGPSATGVVVRYDYSWRKGLN